MVLQMEALNHNHFSYTEEAESQAEEEEEEEYINLEVDHDSSFATIFPFSKQEFEFQSFSSSSDKLDQYTTTSPADELFYMGKLLPLHLPPRLQMVEKILMHTNYNPKKSTFEDKTEHFQDESFCTPLTSNTPFESCNISPTESCQVSRELNPNEYFLDCDMTKCKEAKKSWTKKLKWAYVKSFFSIKSAGCSNNQISAAEVPKAKYCADFEHSKVRNKSSGNVPFGQIKYNNNLMEDYYSKSSHRRSFSGAFKMFSKHKKILSSSTSCSSSNIVDDNVMKRSSSSSSSSNVVVSSEHENPIQAAIAHCKRSQDQHQHQQQQYLIVFKK
ncbi:hypothetical protein ACJIZ3_022698 [Penstemon smallii]|uniref:Membrane-associated kinase regulator 4 n=1 Tax=Penstemon smallii TaxID=265156 RepID=A0ABD3TMV7_9LAMI